MPVFQYEAMDASGREVRAEVEAASQEEAVTKIRSKGQFPTRVRTKGRRARAAPAPTKKKGRTFTFGRVGSKQLTQFTRQMSTLQDAGLPILRSLRILEGQTKAGILKNALRDVVEDVEAGSTLSEAMEKHPKAFDRLYVHTVRAGEAGGVLDQILRKLADFMEKAVALKRRIVGAMVYPVMVIGIAVIILFAIMKWIVPRFKEIFDRFEIEGGLPLLTRILISISETVGHYWYLLPAVVFGLWLMLRLVRASGAGHYALDWVKMHLPIIGSIVNRTAVARFTRTLGTLIASGVPILEALNITRETVGNEVVARALPAAQAVGLTSGWPTPRSDVVWRDRTLGSVLVFGITPPYQTVQDYRYTAGQPISEIDLRERRYVVAIGADVAKNLFGGVSPIGQPVRIRGQQFTVVGTIAPKGRVLGQSFDGFALMPISTFESVYGRRRTTQISVKMASAAQIGPAMATAQEAMRVAHHLRPGQPDNFSVETSDAFVSFWKQLTAVLFAVVPAVVAIGIVVGGIVIMNIMLMAVRERTHEIGIRKSVGARQIDIRRQFLAEAIMLATLGGALGAAGGFLFAQAITVLSPLPARVTLWSVALALALGAGVGIIFGVYPAARAARLDPVAALHAD